MKFEDEIDTILLSYLKWLPVSVPTKNLGLPSLYCNCIPVSPKLPVAIDNDFSKEFNNIDCFSELNVVVWFAPDTKVILPASE